VAIFYFEAFPLGFERMEEVAMSRLVGEKPFSCDLKGFSLQLW